jgi:hypothetical protein
MLDVVRVLAVMVCMLAVMRMFTVIVRAARRRSSAVVSRASRGLSLLRFPAIDHAVIPFRAQSSMLATE